MSTSRLFCLRRAWHRNLLSRGRGKRRRICLQLEGAGQSRWVNASLLPPCLFVTTAMQLAMMAAAKWHCVLVANLAPERRQGPFGPRFQFGCFKVRRIEVILA